MSLQSIVAEFEKIDAAIKNALAILAPFLAASPQAETIVTGAETAAAIADEVANAVDSMPHV